MGADATTLARGSRRGAERWGRALERRVTAWAERVWYARHPSGVLLAPLGWVYCAAASLRKRAPGTGWVRRMRLPVPVVVVGNLTVGGTGKTPLVVWLAGTLRADGLRPGVLARGYRGKAKDWPRIVSPDSDPAQVGDEPVLLARRTGCPVVAGPDRVAAARRLLETGSCDLVLCDDGLQDLSLAHDVEIVVLDGARRLGNGRCLPAGPLRESARRLAEVDLVVCRGEARTGELGMAYQAGVPRNVDDEAQERGFAEFRGRAVHAVAGVGNPEGFFGLLRGEGLSVVEHRFPDHHAFGPGDLDFGDGLPVIMTEKDAVKCRGLAPGRAWYVPVEAVLEEAFSGRLRSLLARGGERGQETA